MGVFFYVREGGVSTARRVLREGSGGCGIERGGTQVERVIGRETF